MKKVLAFCFMAFVGLPLGCDNFGGRQEKSVENEDVSPVRKKSVENLSVGYLDERITEKTRKQCVDLGLCLKYKESGLVYQFWKKDELRRFLPEIDVSYMFVTSTFAVDTRWGNRAFLVIFYEKGTLSTHQMDDECECDSGHDKIEEEIDDDLVEYLNNSQQWANTSSEKSANDEDFYSYVCGCCKSREDKLGLMLIVEKDEVRSRAFVNFHCLSIDGADIGRLKEADSTGVVGCEMIDYEWGAYTFDLQRDSMVIVADYSGKKSCAYRFLYKDEYYRLVSYETNKEVEDFQRLGTRCDFSHKVYSDSVWVVDKFGYFSVLNFNKKKIDVDSDVFPFSICEF